MRIEDLRLYPYIIETSKKGFDLREIRNPQEKDPNAKTGEYEKYIGSYPSVSECAKKILALRIEKTQETYDISGYIALLKEVELLLSDYFQSREHILEAKVAYIENAMKSFVGVCEHCGAYTENKRNAATRLIVICRPCEKIHYA